MKKKFNQDLLNEELKRFKLISEYDFYQEKKEEPEYKEIIGGNLKEDDEVPTDLQSADDIDASADKVSNELGLGDDKTNANSGATSQSSEPMQQPTEKPMEEPMQQPAENDVEVDVTSLVKGSEDAKKAADAANKHTQILLHKMTDLEARLAQMAKVSDRIEGLEAELIKRNPTPVEKLEMRSLDSAPFNQKLSDYWADKEGAYDVMNSSKEQNKPKEYVLTKDDVNHDYSDLSIKKSFSSQNLFEEEDIRDYDEETI